METFRYLILTFFFSSSIIAQRLQNGNDLVPCDATNFDSSEPVETMRKTNIGFKAPVTTSAENSYPLPSPLLPNQFMPVSFQQDQFFPPPPQLPPNISPAMQPEGPRGVSSALRQHSPSFTDKVINKIMDVPMNIFDTVTPYVERVNALVKKIKQITSFGSRRKSALSGDLNVNEMDDALRELRAQLKEALETIDGVDSISEESCS